MQRPRTVRRRRSTAAMPVTAAQSASSAALSTAPALRRRRQPATQRGRQVAAAETSARRPSHSSRAPGREARPEPRCFPATTRCKRQAAPVPKTPARTGWSVAQHTQARKDAREPARCHEMHSACATANATRFLSAHRTVGDGDRVRGASADVQGCNSRIRSSPHVSVLRRASQPAGEAVAALELRKQSAQRALNLRQRRGSHRCAFMAP